MIYKVLHNLALGHLSTHISITPVILFLRPTKFILLQGHPTCGSVLKTFPSFCLVGSFSNFSLTNMSPLQRYLTRLFHLNKEGPFFLSHSILFVSRIICISLHIFMLTDLISVSLHACLISDCILSPWHKSSKCSITII